MDEKGYILCSDVIQSLRDRFISRGWITVSDKEVHAALVTDNKVEAMRVALDKAQIEARPVWKPMHKQPCYKDVPAYVNGVSEALFKVGMCLPAGPYVSDDDVKYIVETIKANIIG